MHPHELLAAYDAQLRTAAETAGAESVSIHGPLLLATFPGGRGFISYRDLAGADEQAISELVADALEYYSQQPDVRLVEWKTRGHDHAPGLHEALLGHGFVEGEPESIMIGDAELLAVDVPLPEGVRLRVMTRPEDVLATCVMQGEVFGDEPAAAEAMAEGMLSRIARADGTQLWAAEVGGTVISAGRLEPVAGTDFAGLWGGCTRAQWRGRGVYRALTAARARSALRLGKKLLNSDSTDFSRPILERSGLVKVSTTTPYEWSRG